MKTPALPPTSSIRKRKSSQSKPSKNNAPKAKKTKKSSSGNKQNRDNYEYSYTPSDSDFEKRIIGRRAQIVMSKSSHKKRKSSQVKTPTSSKQTEGSTQPKQSKKTDIGPSHKEDPDSSKTKSTRKKKKYHNIPFVKKGRKPKRNPDDPPIPPETIQKYLNGEYQRIVSIDPGMKLFITACIRKEHLGRVSEENFQFNSKVYHQNKEERKYRRFIHKLTFEQEVINQILMNTYNRTPSQMSHRYLDYVNYKLNIFNADTNIKMQPTISNAKFAKYMKKQKELQRIGRMLSGKIRNFGNYFFLFKLIIFFYSLQKVNEHSLQSETGLFRKVVPSEDTVTVQTRTCSVL